VIQGDSAIPGSRATGATTSTITRDCDRPIDERKGLLTVQNVKRGSETSAEKGWESNGETPTTRLPKQQEDQKGIIEERGGGSVTLLGKRAIRRRERVWVLTMNTHGVEFSIARGVEEIVRDPNPLPRGCPYIGVLPSILTLRDSYSRVTQLMTHSES